MGGQAFAAKCYFYTGRGQMFDVPKEENLEELQKELLCGHTLKRTVTKFKQDARANGISIYGEPDLAGSSVLWALICGCQTFGSTTRSFSS